MPKIKSTISKRIKALRTEKNISQAQLATNIKSARGTIAQYEAGTRNPSYAMLNLIAEALDTTAGYLIGNTDNPDRNDDTPTQVSHNPNVTHNSYNDTVVISGLLPNEIIQVEQYAEFLKSQRNNSGTSSN